MQALREIGFRVYGIGKPQPQSETETTSAEAPTWGGQSCHTCLRVLAAAYLCRLAAAAHQLAGAFNTKRLPPCVGHIRIRLVGVWAGGRLPYMVPATFAGGAGGLTSLPT